MNGERHVLDLTGGNANTTSFHHLNELELAFQGAVAAGLRVGILHPVDRVQVAQAAIELLAIDLVVRRAVRAPARLLGVGCGGGEDVNVRWKEVLEHGPRLAGFHVEHQLRKHFVGSHRLQSLVQVGGVEEITVRELNDASACTTTAQTCATWFT